MNADLENRSAAGGPPILGPLAERDWGVQHPWGHERALGILDNGEGWEKEV